MDSAPLVLFPFRYRDPRTGKWVLARYKASRSELERRYAEWEITGPGEVRRDIGGNFYPHRKLIAHDELKRLSEPPLRFHPNMDGAEVLLVRLFLRRYVTYCARRGRYAQMNGSANLLLEIGDATNAHLGDAAP